MKIRFKRVVSAVCALALCASMIPASALAEPVVSGTDNAIVEQLENTPDQDSVGTVVSGAGQENEEMIAVEGEEGTEPAAPAEGEEDTQQPTAPVEGEEDTQQPAAPVEGEEDTQQPAAPVEGEEDTQQPAAPVEGEEDTQQPAAPVEGEEDQSRAANEVRVDVGSTITYTGSGRSAWSHSWSIISGSANVEIRNTDQQTVQITGRQAGQATLMHEYFVPFVGTQTEYVTVNVGTSQLDRKMYLFVAKPGNTTLSDVGEDYYYLAHGGKVVESATESTFVKNTQNEEAVTRWVDTWPTRLDFLTTASSTSVGEGSTWKIDENTGAVSEFELWLGDMLYTSGRYGIRWAKFSWADTSSEGNHFHVDAILFEKKDVEDILAELQVKKLLTGFSLDDSGQEKTSETFNFKIVDLTDDGSVQGDVEIPLTATVNNLDTPVSLDAGVHSSDILAPGHYMLYEDNGDNDKVWKDTKQIKFDVYTNGTVHVVTEGDNTITNTPATYTLKYDLNGGQADAAFNDVSGLKYNAKTNVSSKTPSYTGNVFRGWATDSDSQTVTYQPGADLQIKGDTTLYAVWGPVSVKKELVLSTTSVDDGINKDDYAAITTENGSYVVYTLNGNAEILYKVTVNAYKKATVKIDEKAIGGKATYVTAVGATTDNNGATFTMQDATAYLYYKISVTGAGEDGTPVENSVDWTIESQTGTAKAADVTVKKTDKTVLIEKQITNVVRNGESLTGPFSNDTILRVGDVVTWQVDITNKTPVELTSLTIHDVTSATGKMPTQVTLGLPGTAQGTKDVAWSTNDNGNQEMTLSVTDIELQQNEKATLTYTYTVAEGDQSAIDAKDLVNSASVNDAESDPASKARTKNFVEVPAIEVKKEGTPRIIEGDGYMVIDYTIQVTNNSNTSLTSIALTDAKFPADKANVTVKIDNATVAGNNIAISDKTITVTDTLRPEGVLTLTYTCRVVEKPKDDGTLTVQNTVDVTAKTADNAQATGKATSNTEVYSGKIQLDLAPIVIYTGGDGSSQAIVGEEGKPTTSKDNGLPTFGVTMTMPDNEPVTVENPAEPVATLYDVDASAQSWSAVAYNNNATVLMQLQPEGYSRNVRIQLKDEAGQTVEDYKFNVENTLYRQYNTSLYVKEDQDATIIAEVKDKFYTVKYENSTLTIRGATKQAENSKVVNDVSQLTQNAEYPEALLPVGTQYCYVSSNGDNKGQLKVANTSGVSLLVDEIVDQTVAGDQVYVRMMKDRAEKVLLGSAPAGSNRAWRFYYMDLVLKTNGNAVLTADQDATIYWPYPNGITYQDAVSGNYTFKVVHYGGLARNYESGNFEKELNDCTLKTYTVQATEQGLRFTVPEADGFSPFALVYERVVNNDQGGSSDNNNSNNNTNTVSQAKAEETVDQPATAPAAVTLIPQTGDDMPFALLAVVAALAAAAVVALAVLRRRSKK